MTSSNGCNLRRGNYSGCANESCTPIAQHAHDGGIKWKHFPRYWPFVRRIHRSRWIPRTKASDAELWFFFICARINGWVNSGEAGDLGRNCAHYDVNVMYGAGNGGKRFIIIRAHSFPTLLSRSVAYVTCWQPKLRGISRDLVSHLNDVVTLSHKN